MPTQSAPRDGQSAQPQQSPSRSDHLPTLAGLADWQLSALQQYTASRPLLVTDDDMMSRKFYRALLQQTNGLNLIDTWDPLEAVRICRTQPISLVITCIIKPRSMDGLDLMADLRADPRTKSIPLLFITGSHHARDMVLDAGAEAFLTKPCHPNEILQEIWRLLRSHVL